MQDRTTGSAASVDDRPAVFPLPLVPFERYMLVDDRPEYPMSFVAVVELRGEAGQSALEASVQEALARHPLLTARLRRVGLKQTWTAGPETPRVSAWFATDDEAAAFLDEPLNLERSAGLRLAITVREGTTVMRFLFHHAVCDGIGAFRFIGDVLACYGRRTAPLAERPTLLPVDVQALRHRGEFDLRLPAPVTRWQATRSLIRETWKVLIRRPRPLQSRGTRGRHGTASVGRPAVLTIPAAIVRRYRAAATRHAVTVNDLLLRDMFLVIRQWNASVGHRSSRGWLRVTVPTSLRFRHESRLPAANVLGYALISRRAADCDLSPGFLAGLRADMDFTRKWGLGALFVHAIGMVDRVPGLFWLWTRSRACFSTVVFSNIGDLVRRFRARFPLVDGRVRAGDLILERIYGAPPVRPGTRAALAVVSYTDVLTIALRHDACSLSAEDAESLLQMLRLRLEQTASEEVAEPSGG